MNTKDKTPQELALLLLSGAMAGHTIELGNEGLQSVDLEHPGVLDLALASLMAGEESKAAEHLRRAVKLCAEPVADSRAQAQRTRLLSAAAGALALLEQPNYRGPDRRSGTDRRSNEDRRHLDASPAPVVLEQRCGEDRRGRTERRNPLRDALFKAGNDAWDLQAKAAYELVPLLAVAEFAARAHHTLTAFEFRASHDATLMERLNDADGEWRTGMDDMRTPLRIAQCIGIARLMTEKLVDAIDGVSERAYEACEGEAKREKERAGSTRSASAGLEGRP